MTRTMKLSRIGAALAGLAAMTVLPSTASSHHSFSSFDMQKEQVLVGTIQKFEWTNPHTWIWITVTAKGGKTQVWGIEGLSPSILARRGWSRTALKPGDKVTMAIHPLRSGQAGGSIVRVTLPSGKVLGIFGQTDKVPGT